VSSCVTCGLLLLYSEAGNYDRLVIQELLKEIAQTQQVDLNAKQRFKGTAITPSSLAFSQPYSPFSRHY